MKPEISAVILAGGLGKRMGILTQERHKALLEVEGKPILNHIFDCLQSEFGSAKVILATGHQGEKIKKTYGKRYGNIQLEYVHSPKRLEARKRLLLADGLLEGPFFVMGTDVIAHSSHYTNVIQTLNLYSPQDIYGVISGAVDIQPAPTHALISVDGNRAVDIQIHPPFDYTKPDLVRNMSLYYFDQKTLHLLKHAPPSELKIAPVLKEAIKHGAEYMVEKYYDNWYHFAIPKDLQVRLDFKLNNIKGK